MPTNFFSVDVYKNVMCSYLCVFLCVSETPAGIQKYLINVCLFKSRFIVPFKTKLMRSRFYNRFCNICNIYEIEMLFRQMAAQLHQCPLLIVNKAGNMESEV